MSEPIRVYRIPFSTNVERVALAAAHKGVAIDWVDLDPGDRSPVVELSGQDLVPVLQHGSDVVADSTEILRWLEARFPDQPLWPEVEPERTQAEVFVEWFNRVWKIAPNAIADELDSGSPDAGRIAALGEEMRRALGWFEGLLSARDFLLGEQLGVADVIAFPFLKYGLFIDPADDETFHRVLADEMPIEPGHPRLAAWVRRIDALPRA